MQCKINEVKKKHLKIALIFNKPLVIKLPCKVNVDHLHVMQSYLDSCTLDFKAAPQLFLGLTFKTVFLNLLSVAF